MLYILQHPHVGAQFFLHGDCLSPLESAKGTSTWQNEPNPHLCASIAAVVEKYKNVSFRHVKSHDWHPWNEAADATAKFVATRNCAVGTFPLDPVPVGLLAPEVYQWVLLAATNDADAHAWPTCSGRGLAVSNYAPASRSLVHPPIHSAFDEGRKSSSKVWLDFGTINILTSGGGKVKPKDKDNFVSHGG